ncbi:S41 family peptidase [Aromatoleum bremense]|uniref:PDZ domain-containing protein n=1 Tax=Aromatoleum bremense TaxID=76115 RepID=A0ABX1NS16_9RHOO|nr:S41 family peptidase [Aromatoleum bremense]NMG14769.1 PDZ domain-containing protein [Aromatoleum bremense]QTQ30958.1 Carboxyl-terminal-processing protease [Aromatoleum bremense]
MRNKLQKAGLIMTGVFAGVLISLNFPASADKVSPAPLPVEELRAFADVFNAIKQGYVEPVEDKKLINHAISGMLSGLDPHSAYLDVEAYKELQVGTHGEFGGLGIEVGMEDGFVKVISPIEDTPAFRSGVKAGDLIVKLDETPVKGMTLSDAVKRMRGKPKTDITLTIVRKGEDRPVVVTLTREVIKVQSVKSKMVEPGYGYLRVAQFQENTSQAVAEHLAKLAKEGDMKGLVLDLRNDPGGLLHGAVGVASAFLPANALVVSTDGRTDDAKREYRARADDYLRGSREDFLKDLPAGARTLPMVVLVNAGSASASEIVAGALQDHRRAVVMGTQTFGKGSVQTILPLNSNTAIKLTTARYYTPSGRSIQAKGIEPDIIVEETANGSSRRLREADLERHLGNDRDPEAEPKKADEPKAGDQSPADDEAEALPRPELASKDDYQLNQAINLLKGLQIVQNKKE